MSRVYPKPLNTVEGITRGGIATCKLDNGFDYHELVFVSNIPPAEIEKFTVNLGGQNDHGDIVDVFATELYMLEAYKGRHQENYKYVIPFASLEGKTDIGQMYSALVALPGDNILVNIHLKTVPAENTTVPTFKGIGLVASGSVDRFFIPQLKTQTVTVTASGEIDYGNLPRDAEIRRIHWKGDIDRMQLHLGADKVWDATADDNTYVLKRPKTVVPQTGYYHMDFVARGWVANDTFKPQEFDAQGNYRGALVARLTIGDTPGNVRALIESVKMVKMPPAA